MKSADTLLNFFLILERHERCFQLLTTVSGKGRAHQKSVERSLIQQSLNPYHQFFKASFPQATNPGPCNQEQL